MAVAGDLKDQGGSFRVHGRAAQLTFADQIEFTETSRPRIEAAVYKAHRSLVRTRTRWTDNTLFFAGQPFTP